MYTSRPSTAGPTPTPNYTYSSSYAREFGSRLEYDEFIKQQKTRMAEIEQQKKNITSSSKQYNILGSRPGTAAALSSGSASASGPSSSYKPRPAPYAYEEHQPQAPQPFTSRAPYACDPDSNNPSKLDPVVHKPYSNPSRYVTTAQATYSAPAQQTDHEARERQRAQSVSDQQVEAVRDTQRQVADQWRQVRYEEQLQRDYDDYDDYGRERAYNDAQYDPRTQDEYIHNQRERDNYYNDPYERRDAYADDRAQDRYDSRPSYDASGYDRPASYDRYEPHRDAYERERERERGPVPALPLSRVAPSDDEPTIARVDRDRVAASEEHTIAQWEAEDRRNNKTFLPAGDDDVDYESRPSPRSHHRHHQPHRRRSLSPPPSPYGAHYHFDSFSPFNPSYKQRNRHDDFSSSVLPLNLPTPRDDDAPLQNRARHARGAETHRYNPTPTKSHSSPAPSHAAGAKSGISREQYREFKHAPIFEPEQPSARTVRKQVPGYYDNYVNKDPLPSRRRAHYDASAAGARSHIVMDGEDATVYPGPKSQLEEVQRRSFAWTENSTAAREREQHDPILQHSDYYSPSLGRFASHATSHTKGHFLDMEFGGSPKGGSRETMPAPIRGPHPSDESARDDEAQHGIRIVNRTHLDSNIFNHVAYQPEPTSISRKKPVDTSMLHDSAPLAAQHLNYDGSHPVDVPRSKRDAEYEAQRARYESELARLHQERTKLESRGQSRGQGYKSTSLW